MRIDLPEAWLRFIGEKKAIVSNRVINREEGSLTIFISALFLLTMIFSFETIDIANSYLAKRHLIQIGESALQRGAHQISKDRYFNSDLTIESSPSGVAHFRVPIDCVTARSAFDQELRAEHLGSQTIETIDWSCLNDVLIAKIRAKIQPPLVVPLLSALTGNSISIDATVSASSVISS
ncbi:MAG: hypothetical protein WCH42_07010 [Actinomycetes bacterium]